MKDNELRGKVLQTYYDLRHLGYFQWINEDVPQDKWPVQSIDELTRICGQLAEKNLIEWKARTRGGQGKITALGVDVIEGVANPPISITLDRSHTVSIHNSQNVQVGDHNNIEALVQVGKINKAIDISSFSPQQKAEAKSLLGRFLEHPVIAAIIGGLAGTVR